ncbi:UNVERIFIED_CONTAM: hypothetical protein Sradi_3312300 [Sesamum radiatum]|uniref:DUF4283 domain-containing protein n=1 Tax=Sesamum radiatum TaxID=300843 RepID=A0AAW2R212_SESRA
MKTTYVDWSEMFYVEDLEIGHRVFYRDFTKYCSRVWGWTAHWLAAMKPTPVDWFETFQVEDFETGYRVFYKTSLSTAVVFHRQIWRTLYMSTPAVGLKPVATRRPTPFPPPMRAPCRALRTLLPAGDSLSPAHLLTTSADAGQTVDEPVEDALALGMEAPPPRVLEERPSSMQTRVSSIGTLAAQPVNDAIEARGTTVSGLIEGVDAPGTVSIGIGEQGVGVAAPTPTATIGATKPASPGSIGGSQTAAPEGFMPVSAPMQQQIATAFHNSTGKTLSFVPPTTQNGEIVVRPTLDIIRNGSRRWSSTAVGYFLGRRPYFHHVKDYARSIWSRVREVTATSNGFFFFQFETTVAMEEVIEGGPWLLNGQPIILQKWEPGMVLRKLQHTQVPVWIKLRHLPVELWTNEGLSTVASGIGKPLYLDAITEHARDWTSLVYALSR